MPKTTYTFNAPLALQGTTYSILDSPANDWNWLNIGAVGTTASITATQPGTTLSLGGYSPTATAFQGRVQTIVNDVIADGTGTMAVNIVGNASGSVALVGSITGPMWFSMPPTPTAAGRR